MRLAAGAGIVAVLAAACGTNDGRSARAAQPIARVAAGSSDPLPSISAQGVGRASGVPDVLTVAFSVHTEGASAQQTLSDNSEETRAVLDALKSQGVADKDVQTTYMSVGPRYDARTPPRIVGYDAENSFTVKLRDLTRAGAQIDALVGVGSDALQVRGIGYSLNDSTPLLAEARVDAVKRATQQAQQMAGAAGVRLGAVRTISELQPPAGYPLEGRMMTAGPVATATAAPVALEPGSQELTVTVSVVFDIA